MCSSVIAIAIMTVPSLSTKPPRNNNKWEKLKTDKQRSLGKHKKLTVVLALAESYVHTAAIKTFAVPLSQYENSIDHFKIITLQSMSPKDSLPIFLKSFSTCFLLEFLQKMTLLFGPVNCLQQKHHNYWNWRAFPFLQFIMF